MLALLANFGKEKPEAVVRQILHNIGQLSESKNAFLKYQEQLLVLSRLRDLTDTTTQAADVERSFVEMIAKDLGIALPKF